MAWLPAFASSTHQGMSTFDDLLVWPGAPSRTHTPDMLGQGSLLCIIQPTNPYFSLLQESFLADGLLAGTSATPGMFPLYPVPLSSLPCFADEMEEQVKAMELEL